jgi:hypothetical protein
VSDDLHERVAEVRAWARVRIAHCRREEDKFARLNWHDQPRTAGCPSSVLEAATERRALQAVLNMLGCDDAT